MWRKRNMGEKESEKPYLVRSLHDFLTELDKEWVKFRTGSLIGMIASGVLLLVFLNPRFLLLIRKPPRWTFVDLILLLFIAAFLIYSIYALFAQYQFFNRWERRIGLLLHIEEELLSKKLEEKGSK